MNPYCCHHCGKPTTGGEIMMPGETEPTHLEMCQACWDYIGSPAANQEGATMKNRIEMERKLAEGESK